MAMWQTLSLRARLNTLLALVMVLGLVINIARLLLEAAPRVAAEDQSVVRLARGFIAPLVSDLNAVSDPEAHLAERLNRVPLNVALTPADVAKSILYFSCEDSAGITGTSLIVDAGYLAAAEWNCSALR